MIITYLVIISAKLSILTWLLLRLEAFGLTKEQPV